MIALALGFALRNVPATAHAAAWPYALFGYAFLATVTPWTLGGVEEDEFHLRASLGLGLLFALPFWLASRWLARTPYHAIATYSRVMVALWGVHLLGTVVIWLGERLSPVPKEWQLPPSLVLTQTPDGKFQIERYATGPYGGEILFTGDDEQSARKFARKQARKESPGR